MFVMRRLYLNKYFETLFLFSFTYLFAYKLNAHLKVSYTFSIVFVPKSLHNEFVLFILLSLCTRLNQLKTTNVRDLTGDFLPLDLTLNLMLDLT